MGPTSRRSSAATPDLALRICLVSVTAQRADLERRWAAQPTCRRLSGVPSCCSFAASSGRLQSGARESGIGAVRRRRGRATAPPGRPPRPVTPTESEAPGASIAPVSSAGSTPGSAWWFGIAIRVPIVPDGCPTNPPPAGASGRTPPTSVHHGGTPASPPARYRIRNIPLPGSKVTADVSKDAPIAPDEAKVSTVPLAHWEPGPISQPS